MASPNLILVTIKVSVASKPSAMSSRNLYWKSLRTISALSDRFLKGPFGHPPYCYNLQTGLNPTTTEVVEYAWYRWASHRLSTRLNISIQLIILIRIYLPERTLHIKNLHYISSRKIILSEVPTIFNLFVNNIPLPASNLVKLVLNAEHFIKIIQLHILIVIFKGNSLEIL